MNDYGQFVIMPVTRKARFHEDERASWFCHKAEVAKPYYYNVYLADHDVTTEITPTERAAQFRFTFPKSDSSFIIIDALDKGSYIKVMPEENKIIGYTTRNAHSNPVDFKNYFFIYAAKPFDVTYTWKDSTLIKGVLEQQSNHAGAVVGFQTENGEKVNLKYEKNYMTHEDILRGGKMQFIMGPTPHKDRGTQASDFPYSFSRHEK